MDGNKIGFIIWMIVACTLSGIGICDFFSEKAVGFWANSKAFPVKDIRKYNRATGKLLILYGVVFGVLGLPLLAGQDTPYIILSVLGIMAESIAVMAVYSLYIEKKYRK